MRTLKNYRFTKETINQLEDLQKASGKNATELIESLIQMGHDELTAAKAGENHDEILLDRVVGRKMRKSASPVKIVS